MLKEQYCRISAWIIFVEMSFSGPKRFRGFGETGTWMELCSGF